MICRLIKTPFIWEDNEFPRVILKKGFIKLSILDRFRLDYSYKIYDGYIFISEALKKFFEGKTRKNSLVEIVPIVVDNERFNKDYNLTPKNGSLIADIFMVKKMGF